MIEKLRANSKVIIDFLKFGGLDILEKAETDHAEDDYLRQQIPILRKYVLG